MLSGVTGRRPTGSSTASSALIAIVSILRFPKKFRRYLRRQFKL